MDRSVYLINVYKLPTAQWLSFRREESQEAASLSMKNDERWAWER